MLHPLELFSPRIPNITGKIREIRYTKFVTDRSNSEPIRNRQTHKHCILYGVEISPSTYTIYRLIEKISLSLSVVYTSL